MGERALQNRIKRLKELEKEAEAIKCQMDELKDEIRADMDAKGVEEQKVGNYIVRLTTVLTNRFNTQAFKKEHSKLYEQYLKSTESRRFSIA